MFLSLFFSPGKVQIHRMSPATASNRIHFVVEWDFLWRRVLIERKVQPCDAIAANQPLDTRQRTLKTFGLWVASALRLANAPSVLCTSRRNFMSFVAWCWRNRSRRQRHRRVQCVVARLTRLPTHQVHDNCCLTPCQYLRLGDGRSVDAPSALCPLHARNHYRCVRTQCEQAETYPPLVVTGKVGGVDRNLLPTFCGSRVEGLA